MTGASRKPECPSCSSNSTDHPLVYHVNSYPILRCTSCGTMYVEKWISPLALSDHYNSIVDHTYEDSNASHLSYYYQILASNILARMKTSGNTILDIGCSKGLFFDHLSGWTCDGTEVSRRYALAASSRGYNIYTGMFENMPTPSYLYDVVSFQDVLDHLNNPFEALLKANKLLKSGGLLVVKVHDFSCLYARLSSKSNYALIPPTHLTFFSRRGIRSLLRRSGYYNISIHHYAQLISLSLVFLRLSRRNNNIFYRFYRLLSHSRFGSIVFPKNLHDVMTVYAYKQ